MRVDRIAITLILTVMLLNCRPDGQRYDDLEGSSMCYGESPENLLLTTNLFQYDEGELPFNDDGRNIDLSVIISRNSTKNLICWREKGDGVASFALAAKLTESNNVYELVSSLDNTNYIQVKQFVMEAASSRPCLTEDDRMAKFLGCASGLPEAQFILGVSAERGFEGRSLTEALRWYRLAAGQGYVLAEERIRLIDGEG